MNAIVRTLNILFRLFFDDGTLALAIAGLLLALGLLTYFGLLESSLLAMLLLVGGTFLLLLQNVLRAARLHRS